ncbi:MAG: sialidase family protein [Candidatus Zixiibacteriota bacterium]
MKKKLMETTAYDPLGCSSGHRLFKIATGQYSGRLGAVVQTAPETVRLTYADPPYLSWSTPVTLAGDCRDTACDCLMDGDGNLFLAYSENTSGYLIIKKLTFSGGSWTVGAAVTVYSGYSVYSPSLALEPDGRLWVSYSRYVAPNKQVFVKYSDDGGSSWGSGEADPGDQISTGALTAFSRVVVGLNSIHVIYTLAGTQLSVRSLPLAGGSWSESYNIATGQGFVSNFDAAVGPDGLLAVVFGHEKLEYREFDGNNWGAVVTLDNEAQTSPQIFFRNQIPVIVFLSGWVGSQRLIKYTDRQTGSFSSPAILTGNARPFDGVLLYEQGSASYADKTAAAENSTTADLYHPDSGCLLKNPGDRLYLGMANKFRYVEFILATAGIGGTVSYCYWDGANWKAFTPAGGNSYLDAANIPLLLWTDNFSIPADWQKLTIESGNLFWVKIEVTSGYATGAVGTQITAISELETVIFRR